MRKLKNNSGASILMALLLLLLAALVSAVMLSAATAAARHLRDDRQAQQDYLTVSSAAELIRDSILNDSYQKIVTVTEDAEGNEIGEEESVDKPEGLMAYWLTRGIGNGGAVGTGCRETEITVSFAPEDTQTLEAVKAVFSMDSAYNVTVKLSLADDREDACCMTLTLEGERKSTTRSATDETTGEKKMFITTQIQWNSAKIEKGIGETAK